VRWCLSIPLLAGCHTSGSGTAPVDCAAAVARFETLLHDFELDLYGKPPEESSADFVAEQRTRCEEGRWSRETVACLDEVDSYYRMAERCDVLPPEGARIILETEQRLKQERAATRPRPVTAPPADAAPPPPETEATREADGRYLVQIVDQDAKLPGTAILRVRLRAPDGWVAKETVWMSFEPPVDDGLLTELFVKPALGTVGPGPIDERAAALLVERQAALVADSKKYTGAKVKQLVETRVPAGRYQVSSLLWSKTIGTYLTTCLLYRDGDPLAIELEGRVKAEQQAVLDDFRAMCETAEVIEIALVP
jgi:hypothetical protein